jgi:phosphohistidine phosphatase
MDLYLVRHGIAQALGQENDFRDENRPLTVQGREKMREAAKGLKKLSIRLDLILTSPLVRAVETARMLGEGLGIDESMIEQTVNLVPGGQFNDLLAELKQQRRAESIALVGHEPTLGALAARLISGRSDFPIPLKKGSVCCVNITETVPVFRGTLAWILTSKQLRLIGKS